MIVAIRIASSITSNSIKYFSVIIHLPPTSTLFPYTTLFRSPHSPIWGLRAKDQFLRSPFSDRLLEENGLLKKDRKSTRLNSSHANISYAVFCLKKNREPPVSHMSTTIRQIRPSTSPTTFITS